MRGKSIIHFIGSAVITAFVTLSVPGPTIYAQQQEAPQSQQPQDFSAAFQKAHTACMALLADHALDPLRDKFPWEGQKPTFAMLTDPTRVLAKDRPLAALMIKTIEKCKALQRDAIALLPNQTQQRFDGFFREVDSLNARLYLGKITIGEYNVGINRIVIEEKKAFFGDVRPDSDVAKKFLSRRGDKTIAGSTAGTDRICPVCGTSSNGRSWRQVLRTATFSRTWRRSGTCWPIYE